MEQWGGRSYSELVGCGRIFSDEGMGDPGWILRDWSEAEVSLFVEHSATLPDGGRGKGMSFDCDSCDSAEDKKSLKAPALTPIQTTGFLPPRA